MEVIKPYDQLYTTDKLYVILSSGRIGGKTKASAQYIIYCTENYNDRDIIVLRSAYSDLKGSLYAELLTVLDEENLMDRYETRTAPLSIRNKETNCTIHFKGAGGSDSSRTRGTKGLNPLSLIFFEETQQLQEEANLNQALATFRRNLDVDIAKVIIAYNPEPMNMHWLNMYTRAREDDQDYLIIKSSYKDIAHKLNYEDLRAIEKERLLNFKNYEYMYLGVTNGLFGSVYYTFNRYKHLVSEEKAKEIIKRLRVHSIVFGTDGATTRDATGVVPILVLQNGQSLILDRFYHDPKKTKAISNGELVQLIKVFVNDIIKKYNIQYNVPKYFSVDGANSDLRLVLNYQFPSTQYTVFPYTNKKIINMAKNVQNVFANNFAFVVDTCGYKNYLNGVFMDNEYPFINQLESVVWNKIGNGFDPIVPNDLTDALTYGINLVYNAPQNLYFPKHGEYYEV